ncbi:uncharacterized protein LOC144912265 isoform X2 [Branchiostoma floridae x Branchiostoma belcheri]
MRVSRHVSAALVVTFLVCILISPLIREVCGETCAEIYSVERLSEEHGGDKFTNPDVQCSPSCNGGNTCPGSNAYDGGVSYGQCRCRCFGEHRTFNFRKCVDLQGMSSGNPSQSRCGVRLQPVTEQGQVPLRTLPTNGGAIEESNLWRRKMNTRSLVTGLVTLHSAEYLGHDHGWYLLSQRVGVTSNFFSITNNTSDSANYIMYDHPQAQSIANCFEGLIIKLNLTFRDPDSHRQIRNNCVLFKLAGELKYNNSGILPCQGLQPPDTTHNTDADDTTSSGSSNGEKDEMSSPIGAVVGGVCAAAVIFIVGGVVLFILWRRKFRPSLSKKNKNQRVTMSSLQNGHPHPTEGTVDNVIYAGDNAGIVDNLIYEGGMGADGVFSNPGYADKTPQFKPRMDVPGAFVQPNPGATNKTPQPQRNVIIDEPQYAQIVDDQYADPQKVRDKKNKKRAAKDKNYADLHGPQPGANNSNSNHVYQGLNKGTDYQSLRGPREHHEVRPSQVPKTPQDGHDYASLTPGGSKPSAGTLSNEGPDYTVLEGPDSPGEETAAGPDYTTLDGPDSPGDEITSGPDYTVLDGPDSPGD